MKKQTYDITNLLSDTEVHIKVGPFGQPMGWKHCDGAWEDIALLLTRHGRVFRPDNDGIVVNPYRETALSEWCGEHNITPEFKSQRIRELEAEVERLKCESRCEIPPLGTPVIYSADPRCTPIKIGWRKYSPPRPVVWVRERDDAGGGRYHFCDKRGKPIKDGIGNTICVCDANQAMERLRGLGLDIDVRVWEPPAEDYAGDYYCPKCTGRGGLEKYCSICGTEKVKGQRPQEPEWVYGVWYGNNTVQDNDWEVLINGRWGNFCGSVSIERILNHLLNWQIWYPVRPQTTTPTFGVRRLTEGDFTSRGDGVIGHYGAFRDGKYIKLTNETTPEQVIEWVLEQLKPATPATPAVTLADLEVVG